MTEVDRGIIAVSSSYSVYTFSVLSLTRCYEMLTFIGVFIVDAQVKVCAVTQPADVDDFALKLKDTDTCSIKGNSCWLFLRFELEVNR